MISATIALQGFGLNPSVSPALGTLIAAMLVASQLPLMSSVFEGSTEPQALLSGALVLVVLGIAVSWALDLAGQGVSVTGEVPSGLPHLEVPDVSASDLATLAAADRGSAPSASGSILAAAFFL